MVLNETEWAMTFQHFSVNSNTYEYCLLASHSISLTSLVFMHNTWYVIKYLVFLGFFIFIIIQSWYYAAILRFERET